MYILTSIISIITEYTVELVGRQVGYLIHYKRNFENLRSQLENLDAAKDRMKHMVDEDERKGKTVHTDVQKWLTEANKMIQEANKLLDDEDRAKTKCFRGVCPNLVSHHQLSRKSAKLTKQIELIEKVEFPSVSYNARLEEIFDTPPEDYMAFESRISMVNKIMAELRNPGTNLVGVYGLGGVGKSTLVQEVYRQAKTEKLFDDVVLVLDVKNFPEAEKKERIQKKIAEKLDMDVQESQDMEARAKHLWNRIKDKKSLVILDDVWEAINLEALGLRPMATCKILFTSRVRDSDMRPQKDFWLDVLDEKESWSLFEKVAGDVVKDDPIQKVATQVAQKCGRLPVLVVTVAGALRLNSSLEVWKDTLRRFKRFDGKELTEKARLAIEWSYNRLDAEQLQPLFLLCGIIAGGNCSIHLSDLLKYAMGLGLIKHVDTVEEARNALHSQARKLKDYCLLLGSDDDGRVRMHELVQDVAICIASKDKHVFSKADTDELKEWPNRDVLKNCSAISLNYCKIPGLDEVPWECPELNLFYLGNSDNSLEIPSNFFEKMEELKVLDLTKLHFSSLPPSLQSLTNLQTLCLDRCVLGDIALVGHLTNLKVLSLLKSKVKELPKEIGQLTRLQLLDLTGCSELVLIPPGVISSLTSLEDLRMGINSFKQWEGEGSFGGKSNASVSELKHLSQLTALDIHIPDANLLPANVFSDTRLERYTILIGDCWPRYPRIYGTSSNMLKLKLTSTSQFGQDIKLLLERCEHLYLDGVEAANIISYILASDSGKQLKNLHVQNNDAVTAVINSSHAFPILESLSLDNLVNLETVCCGQLIAQPFQKLRTLTLRNLPKLIGLSSKGSTSAVSTEAEEIILENEIGGPTKLFMNGEVLMPNLTRLILHQCDGLRFLFSFFMARSLVQLELIEISECQMMEEIVSTTSGYNQEHTDNMFCNLKYLNMQHLPSLTRFCSGSYFEFSLLKTLLIEDCPRLGTFIFDRKSEITTIMGKENEDRNSKENLDTVIAHFLFDEKAGFPSLERLIIRDLLALRTIWHNRLAPNSFCKLWVVEVLRCDTLINIFQPSMMGRLNALHTLRIKQCQSLQVVFELGGVFEAYDTLTTQLKTFECPNLHLVEINACERLINIFPASVAKSLEQLIKLSVENCGGLRFLFSSSIARSLVQLKKLKISRCQIMEEIVPTNECSEEDTYHNMFSQLQDLRLQYLPNLTRFCSARRSINFHSLEILHLEDCSKLETFRFDPMSTNTTINRATGEIRDSMENIGTDAQYFLFDKKVGFPSLERLIICDLLALRTIWHNRLAPNSFCKLKKVEVLRCNTLINIFAPSMMGRLNALHTLTIKQCQSLQVVFELEGLFEAYDTSTTQLKTFECPNLHLVEIDVCERLINIFPASAAKSLEQLMKLSVENCGGLRFLFSSSIARSLVQLKKLKISRCQIMEEIVPTNESSEEDTDHNIFSQLQDLRLQYLPNLIRFCSARRSINFHSLEILHLEDCSKFETFIFDPMSSNITINKATGEIRDSMENIGTDAQYFLFVEKVGFPSLERLIIRDLPVLRTIWHNRLAPNSFCKLKKVEVLRCNTLINIFVPSMMGRLNALDNLKIQECKSLQVVFEQTYDTSTTQLKTFECPNLDSIHMHQCESLKNIFPASVAKGLQQLREMYVENCGILEEIVAKEEVETTLEFVFSKVTLVHFKNLPKLRSFYPGLYVSNWPLLKSMKFSEYGKVEIFASEYSRFQERLDSGAPIRQPFLLVDKGNSFPNLERLVLFKNMEIWYEAHGPLPTELFINLKLIRFSCAHPNSFSFLQKLHNLEDLHVYGGPWKEIFVYEGTSSGEIDAVGRTLPHIKNLCLRKMKELMHLGNDNSESIFPNLEILRVCDCVGLKNLTSSTISFRYLTALHVRGCEGLKYITTYSVAKYLQQLKRLKVKNCKSMIVIVASNRDEEDSGNYYEIAFSSLQRLELSDLPSLQGFCSSGNCTIRVPSLNPLIVEKCLIELKISHDGLLIQSGSRPERLQITEEVEEEKEKEEDDGNETLIAHTS